jgi:putative membrane protein
MDINLIADFEISALSNFLIGLVAALHVGFLILEIFFWESDLVQKRIAALTQELGQQGIGITGRLAMNMGLYNGFLAAGLVWGLLATQQGFSIKLFFLVCIIIAGVFGALTVKKSIFFFQALPGILAFIFMWFTQYPKLF